MSILFLKITITKITGVKPKVSFGNISQQTDGYYNLRCAGYPHMLCIRDNSTCRHYHTAFVMSEFHWFD